MADIARVHEQIRRRARPSVGLQASTMYQQVTIKVAALDAAQSRYLAGSTLRVVASEVGISRTRLAGLLRERGVRLRRVSPPKAEVN